MTKIASNSWIFSTFGVGSNNSKCPTYGVLNAYPTLSISGSYSSSQLVKQSDISKVVTDLIYTYSISNPGAIDVSLSDDSGFSIWNIPAQVAIRSSQYADLHSTILYEGATLTHIDEDGYEKWSDEYVCYDNESDITNYTKKQPNIYDIILPGAYFEHSMGGGNEMDEYGTFYITIQAKLTLSNAYMSESFRLDLKPSVYAVE